MQVVDIQVVEEALVESFGAFACAFEELSQPLGFQMLRRYTLRGIINGL